MNILPHELPSSHWLKVAMGNGLHPDTFRYRVRQGCSPEKAATLPPNRFRSKKSIRSMAMDAGIPVATVYDRIKKQDKTLEEALAT